jgi:hypothetical protein
MDIYVVQSVLARMLRTANDVQVTMTLISKNPTKFSAGFAINGKSNFVLCTDGFKPRRLSGMTEIESLVRRSCVALQTFGVTVVDFGRLGGKPTQSQKELDTAAAKLATLAAAAQATITADNATLATINGTWAASAHKTQRIADLTNEIQAAQGVADLAADGTLPDGTTSPVGGGGGTGGDPGGGSTPLPDRWPPGDPAPTQADADKFGFSLSEFIGRVVNANIWWTGTAWTMGDGSPT